MAKFSRLKVLNAIVELGLVPIFFHKDLAEAKQIVVACERGGARVVEYTNRGDQAWQVFSELIGYSERAHPAVILGIGSIIDAPTAAMYIASGANFIVGPTFNPEIATLCNRRKIAYIPGCSTITEISEAEATGVELVKLFPGDAVGPRFVKALHEPQPWTRVLVTGGVLATQDNVRAWFEAGATAVGMGSQLIRDDWVAAGDYTKISDTVAQVLGWIQKEK